MPTFDGVNLTVTLDAPTAGVLAVDVREDLYEGWKDWLLADSTRLGFPRLFRPVSGDPLSPSLDLAGYFFLQNQSGWRIVSTDEDQEVNYEGNLVPEDPALPVIVSTPGRTVLHLGLQPVTQRTPTILDRITDLWRRRGLDVSAPVVISDNQITFGGVTITITEGVGDTTLQRL